VVFIVNDGLFLCLNTSSKFKTMTPFLTLCMAFTADGETALQPTENFHLKAARWFSAALKTISSIFFSFTLSDSTDHYAVSKSFCFDIFPIWLFPAVNLSFLFLFSHRDIIFISESQMKIAQVF